MGKANPAGSLARALPGGAALAGPGATPSP